MIRIENLSDDTQNKLTKALLESSLLFAHSDNKLVGVQRNEVFLKTVFAIIVSENKPCDSEQIVRVFSEKFNKEINPEEINKAIKEFCNKMKQISKSLNPNDDDSEGKLQKIIYNIVEDGSKALETIVQRFENDKENNAKIYTDYSKKLDEFYDKLKFGN